MILGPLGGVPEDPGGDDSDDRRGGWVPPEDRTWRHPSEMVPPGLRAANAPVAQHRLATTLAIGTTAALATAIGLLLLVNASSGPALTGPGTQTISTAAVTHCCRLSAPLARQAEEATVSLESSSGRSIGCGVVLGNGDLDGDLVATSAAAVSGLRRIRAVTATGRALAATVLATDPDSGIALVELPTPLPPVPMDGHDDVQAGTRAMAVSMASTTTDALSSGGGRPRPVWTSGTVVSVGTPVPGWGVSGMAAIVVRGASVPDVPGEPLVDREGKVVGILAGSVGPDRAFLPMSLVVGVSEELDTIGQVRHGWLDVTDETGETSVGSTGARVVSVEPQGASADALQPGDVIVGVNGTAVRSSADLRSILYVMPPGVRVTVDALRGEQLIKAVVELSASP